MGETSDLILGICICYIILMSLIFIILSYSALADLAVIIAIIATVLYAVVVAILIKNRNKREAQELQHEHRVR